jgi:uncharacterized protein (DUF934 family)
MRNRRRPPLPEVIRNGRVENDDWRFLGVPGVDAAPASLDDPQLAAERIAVPLAAWKSRRDEFLRNIGCVGVWLAADDDPAGLAADLDCLRLVAIHFPRFTDGRGYSSAALLRARYGYRGELRAIGDVGRDQLFYLGRCGFDAFSLAPHRDARAALAGLADFSVRYQGSVDDPVPLFRRRLATGASRG